MTTELSSKKYRFFYHFNRLKSTNTEIWWSIHFRDRCIYAKHIKCLVATETKESKKQPRGVVRGFCAEITIKNNEVIIS